MLEKIQKMLKLGAELKLGGICLMIFRIKGTVADEMGNFQKKKLLTKSLVVFLLKKLLQ